MPGGAHQAAECERHALAQAQEAGNRALILQAELDALRQSSAVAVPDASSVATTVHADARESIVPAGSVVGLEELADTSLLSIVSEEGDAIRAFNAGVGRRYTAGAVARDSVGVPPAQAAAMPAGTVMEAAVDYARATAAGQDLHFHAGDRVLVTERGNDGWWWGCVVNADGTRSAPGRFPQSYVRLPGQAADVDDGAWSSDGE